MHSSTSVHTTGWFKWGLMKMKVAVLPSSVAGKVNFRNVVY